MNFFDPKSTGFVNKTVPKEFSKEKLDLWTTEREIFRCGLHAIWGFLLTPGIQSCSATAQHRDATDRFLRLERGFFTPPTPPFCEIALILRIAIGFQSFFICCFANCELKIWLSGPWILCNVRRIGVYRISQKQLCELRSNLRFIVFHFANCDPAWD